jgi:hypothetical protein
MGFNFPNSPTTGQLYPQPPIAGAPVYQWDGQKWTVATGVAGTVYIGDSPPSNVPPGSLWWNSANGQLYVYYNDGNSTQWVYASQASVTPVTRSYLAGLTLSTPGSSASFTVAAGVAADNSNVDMLTLVASLSKTTAAWAAGAGGALDTGTIAINTWYHVHLIKNITTQIVDVLFSLSATSPALPSGYTEFRRIGSMKTDGSSNWIAFSQNGDEFLWSVPVFDLTISNLLGTTAITMTLASVPTGVKVYALGWTNQQGANTGSYIVSSLDTVDTAPATNGIGLTVLANAVNAYFMSIRTNTSAQFRGRANVANVNFGFTTIGWIDHRGRDN